jgi:hypothetical protein
MGHCSGKTNLSTTFGNKDNCPIRPKAIKNHDAFLRQNIHERQTIHTRQFRRLYRRCHKSARNGFGRPAPEGTARIVAVKSPFPFAQATFGTALGLRQLARKSRLDLSPTGREIITTLGQYYTSLHLKWVCLFDLSESGP